MESRDSASRTGDTSPAAAKRGRVRRNSSSAHIEPLAGSYVAIPAQDPDIDVQEDFFKDIVAKEEKLKGHEGTLLQHTLESPYFQGVMALLIVSNSVILGFETDMPDYPHWDIVEGIFLVVFTAELVLRFAATGIWGFFACGRDLAWNLFDLVVVCFGLLDGLASATHFAVKDKHKGGATTAFRIIRLMRILRIFKIIRFLKQLYLLAYGLAEAAQAVLWVSILMTFVLYVCSILLVRSIGHPPEDDPNKEFLAAHFGDVRTSMLSLFVLMACSNLPEYASEAELLSGHPQLTVFLLIFVMFGSFGMIALLTGVISESMFDKNQLRIEEERQERESMRKWMQDKCRALFKMLKLDGRGEAESSEVMKIMPLVARLFDVAQVDYMKEELLNLVNVMDTDGTGTVSEEEFCHALVTLAAGVRSISLQEMFHLVCQMEVRIVEIQENVAKSFHRQEPLEELVTSKLDELLAGQRFVGENVRECFRKSVDQIHKAVPAGIKEAASAIAAAVAMEGERRARSQVTETPPLAADSAAPRSGSAPKVLPRPAFLVTSALSPFEVEGFDLVFQDRMAEVLRSHSDALAKVLALEAQAVMFENAPLGPAEVERKGPGERTPLERLPRLWASEPIFSDRGPAEESWRPGAHDLEGAHLPGWQVAAACTAEGPKVCQDTARSSGQSEWSRPGTSIGDFGGSLL